MDAESSLYAVKYDDILFEILIPVVRLVRIFQTVLAFAAAFLYFIRRYKPIT